MLRLISAQEFMQLSDICFTSSFYSKKILRKGVKNIIYCDIPFDKKFLSILKSAIVIFIKIDFVDIIFNNLYQYFGNDVIIITHAGDAPVTKDKLKYLNCSKVKKWYAQNTLISHSKLVSIPIGISIPDRRHGDIALMKKIMKENIIKKNLLYVNFNIQTNYQVRSLVMDLLKRKGYKTIGGVKSLDQELYWRELSSSKFCISPPGNGIDCHRIWECIYLNTIPICINNIGYEQFKELPILFIDDWNVINDEFLERKWEEFSQKTFDTRMCYMDYWRNLII